MFILSILGCNRTTKSDKHPENDHPQSEHRKTGLVIIISVLLSPTCEICHIWMHRYGCSGQATAEEDLDFSAYGLGTSGGVFPQRHRCPCAQSGARSGGLLQLIPSHGWGCCRSSAMPSDSLCRG